MGRFVLQLMLIGCLYIIACCACTFSLFFVDASLREMGVLPPITPALTSTPRPFLTNTPIPTSPPTTPTYTPSPTNTFMYADVFIPTATQTATPTATPTDTPTPTPTAPPATSTPIPQPTAQPTEPPAPTSVPVLIILIGLTSPIERGFDATLAIQTNPGAFCDPSVFYDTVESTAAGLEAKPAPDNGSLTWTWLVGANTNGGTWTVSVECDGSEKSWPFTVRE
jgi:hypothetical protein